MRGYYEYDEAPDPLANPCAFCDQDPCRCYCAPPPRILSPQDLIRVGALTLEQERSLAVEQLLDTQGEAYEQASRADLIEALRSRDWQLAQLGRQFADGRTASRLLREFMRGMLLQSDHAGLDRALAGTKAGKVELILEALGAEPADTRQLKRFGSTLGPLEDPGERAGRLADGKQKE